MSHHLLTLSPTDVLFFRDGRPMEGSSCGHGAAWPMPNVLSSALHHALRRADLGDTHLHRPARNGQVFSHDRDLKGREFGSLQIAGPFPVANGQWLFPRPADADLTKSSATTHRPLGTTIDGAASSLGAKLRPVVNTRPPSKDKAEPWLSAHAYAAYLQDSTSPDENHFFQDNQIFAAEHNIGIGIDPESQSQDGERIYSASYLRLKPHIQLGLIGQCMDKGACGKSADLDLIVRIFPNSGTQTHILAGGQQRTCSVVRSTQEILPLPRGATITGTRVRWTLLTPAIFPELKISDKNPTAHGGGWLPSWIDPTTLRVQLKDPQASARGHEARDLWRKRVASLPAIQATLVAATISRAIPVTGWALTDNDNDGHASEGGAKSTHLAVPAGSVYYFQCDNKEAATALATALNWHSSPPGTSIQNRRSSLMGEKGFGLGVCSTWNFHACSGAL